MRKKFVVAAFVVRLSSAFGGKSLFEEAGQRKKKRKNVDCYCQSWFVQVKGIYSIYIEGDRAVNCRGEVWSASFFPCSSEGHVSNEDKL